MARKVKPKPGRPRAAPPVPRVQVPRSAVPGVTWPALPRWGEAQVLALAFQLDRSQWWSPEALLGLQLRQVENLLAHAAATVPFHRRRLQVLAGLKRGQLTIEAWRRIPVLTRAEVQEAGAALASARVPRGHGQVTDVRTSGSTGRPVEIKTTALAALINHAVNLRYHLWHGRDFSATTAALTRPRPAGSDAPRSWAPGFASGPMVHFDAGQPLAAQLAWLATTGARYLLTYPTNLEGLIEHCRSHGIAPPRLEQIATMGEILDGRVREACERAWKVPVVDAYSAEETGMIALQCPDHPHYHVQSEMNLVEVVDEAGAPCPPGRVGRVVVTVLHNFATPLIRYALGDYAEVGPPCPCGRGLPVLTRILGRFRNMLVTRAGERIWPTYTKALAAAVPGLRQVQLVQREPGQVEARLVVAEPLDEAGQTAARRAIADSLGHGFAVALAFVAEIPRSAAGKFEEVRCEISAAAEPGRGG